MKTTTILSVALLSVINICESKDLIVGTSLNTKLIRQERIEFSAIPLKKRVKEVFYSDPGQKLIKGIILRDLDNSDATATITAGGIDQSYVNIKLKSERGSGLNYNVEIYV